MIPALANYAPQAQITVTLKELFAGREDWWQWYAIDSGGRGHYYEKEPTPEGYAWNWDGGSIFGYKHDMTGVDWQKCIYCRPMEPTEDDEQMFATIEAIAQEIGAIHSTRG